MILLKGFIKGIEWEEIEKSPLTGGKGMILLYPNIDEHPKSEVEGALRELQKLNTPIFVDYGMGIINFMLDADLGECHETQLA